MSVASPSYVFALTSLIVHLCCCEFMLLHLLQVSRQFWRRGGGMYLPLMKHETNLFIFFIVGTGIYTKFLELLYCKIYILQMLII